MGFKGFYASKSVRGPFYFDYWKETDYLGVDTDTYYSAFPRDRVLLKVLVYGVFALEVIQTILTTRDAFGIFATGLRDLRALANVRLLWLSIPILGGVGE